MSEGMERSVQKCFEELTSDTCCSDSSHKILSDETLTRQDEEEGNQKYKKKIYIVLVLILHE